MFRADKGPVQTIHHGPSVPVQKYPLCKRQKRSSLAILCQRPFMTAKIVFSSNKSRANFPVSVGEAEGPGPWDGDGHQDEAEQGEVFEEVDLLVHFRLRILDRPEIVNAERGA